MRHTAKGDLRFMQTNLKNFIVTVRSVFRTKFTVSAKSEREAIRKVYNGNAEQISLPEKEQDFKSASWHIEQIQKAE